MENLNKINCKLITTSIIILVVIGLYILFISISNKKLIMSISNISTVCITNKVLIYSNLEYEVYSTIGDKLKYSGKIKYKGNLNSLVNTVKTYKPDNETLVNYRIVLNNGEEIVASIEKAKELNDFLSLINIDDLFWCN
ncbi:MAG: hypothetical protein ACM3O4_05245 [Ignavibacteriales bacterium]